MAGTYCGKSCENCAQKQSQACPGCEEGPGRLVAGDCALAKCCRDKGWKTCADCEQNAACSMLRGPENLPEHRLDQLVAGMRKKAGVLSRWLWGLFWLAIGWMILNRLLTAFEGAKLNSFLPWLITGAETIYYVAYGLILLRISSECRHYRIAGFCLLAIAVIGTATAWFSNTGVGKIGVAFLLNLLLLVILLIGCYHEFAGHAAVVNDLDFELSYKWYRLWIWYISMIGGLVFSLFLMLALPPLGGLLTIAALIGTIVVSVFRLVNLYRTVKSFRVYLLREMYKQH